MLDEIIVIADQNCPGIGFINPEKLETTAWLGSMVLAEHAGILPLGQGKCAWIDDAGGSVVIMDPFAATKDTPEAALLHQISAAIPGEHLACDPSGRYLAATTGLGASWEPWSDLVTVIDLQAPMAPRSRRFRSRCGEPGVVISETSWGPQVVLRHREPGRIESFDLHSVLGSAAHCPQLEGESTQEVDGTGHGDAYDPVNQHMFTATPKGIERFDVSSGAPEQLPTIAWEVEGRAYFLRFCSRRRLLAAIVRANDHDAEDWVNWQNHLWVHDLETNQTRHTPVGQGLVFRFALTRTGIALARIHPDGDELLVHDLSSLGERGRWPLPPMANAPRAGHAPWDDADRRAIAASGRSEVVAVTRGGHAEVHLVDTSAVGNSLQTVAVPGQLRDGGHLAWMHRDTPAPEDTVGR